ncbi:hypothetical protein [Marinicella meishanensis]|uniref:hypothetical protein n=1 Tax=Marinicella meishanensis TaxID=2873263 RepID=UPI001CBBA33E|nr:hypothetical protein [Marinicella sp. NBU2979]
MDQEPKDPNDANDQAPTDSTSDPVTDEVTADPQAAVDREDGPAAAPVVVKKSGGTFGLLLALVALVAVAYLYYRDWQSQPGNAEGGALQTLVDQTNQRQAELRQALDQAKQQTATLQAQVTTLQQAMDQINNRPEPDSVVVAEPFDNSDNEAQLQQLTDQLQDQNQTLATLQQQIRQLAANPGTAELSPDLLAGWDRQLQQAMVRQSLQSAQILLDSEQTAAAIAAIERLLADGQLAATTARPLRQVLNQLRGIEQPDVPGLLQALDALTQEIQDLTLPTTETAEEAAWYDRFISVKKIDTTGGLASTQALIDLKTELQQDLYQARSFLRLQHQTAWQATLEQAAARLLAQLPKQQALATRLTALSQQAVRAELPATVDLTALIASLEDPQP